MNETPTPLTRRRAGLALATGAGAVLLRPAGVVLAAAAETVPADRRFEVLRKGERIGIHEVRFAPAEGGFTARTAIDVAVKILGLTAFRFEQEATDTWADGVLVRCEARTEEDGKRTEVLVERRGDRLVGRGPRGPIDQPLGIMNDLSWWNVGVYEGTRLLDAQNGGTNPLKSQPPVAEAIEVAGRRVQARRFDASMGSKHTGSNWYAAGDGAWVKTLLRTKGEELDYRLAA